MDYIESAKISLQMKECIDSTRIDVKKKTLAIRKIVRNFFISILQFHHTIFARSPSHAIDVHELLVALHRRTFFHVLCKRADGALRKQIVSIRLSVFCRVVSDDSAQQELLVDVCTKSLCV
jgi:hypothetical protein